MVVDSSNDQNRKKAKPTKAANLDTDIEEIPNPNDDPEEELGEWY